MIHAYALGKSQEVTKILTLAGIPVQQHPDIYAVSKVYQACGMDLGEISEFKGKVKPDHAVVTLPRGMKNFRMAGIKHPVSIVATGWAMDPGIKYQYRVDYALPLSDHADFDDLLETAERVGATEIYCTHGPPEFVGHLRAAGFNAHPSRAGFRCGCSSRRRLLTVLLTRRFSEDRSGSCPRGRFGLVILATSAGYAAC